jgi:two-component system, chemotaxis family, sensor kinase CheA
MTQFSDERGAELRELFFESAQEILQTLNEEALLLEKKPGDAETVRTIRRSVHTLKGDAAACGFRELSELAHELEDALSAEGTSSHTSLAEVAFTATDVFAAMLASYRGQGKLPPEEPLRKMIRELVDAPKTREPRKKKTPAAAAEPTAWTEYETLAIQNAQSRGKRVYQITAQLDPLCAMPIAARQLLLNALATVGEVLGGLPESKLPQATQRVHLLLASAQPAEQIVAKCRIPTVIAHVVVDEVTNSTAAKTAPPEAAPQGPSSLPVQRTKSAADVDASRVELPAEEEEMESRAEPNVAVAENILRVDAERIDSVLNLVGELIIGKSMLQQALNDFARRYPKEATRGRLADALAFQARVLNDLQRSVMKVRMVPVEQLFRRFPRMVRDVAKQCGKNVELVISGQDTDLDKSLLDAIAEPITHLVRNGISHGIETAEERARSGKPARGTIRLDAYHFGNQVIVEVNDDGRGIDTARVIAKAIEKKLISAEKAAELSESDILALVFQPGFSTAQEITEISGRGVGLDVVQSVLHRLKGTVEVVTRPGQGATFFLKLPLTLAIIKALLFRVERRLYAIPLNAVAEISRAREADVHQVDNCEVLQLRGQVLPLVRLGKPHDDLSKNSLTKLFVLVITLGERKLGLIVDGLEGEEELVIKAVDDQTVATDLVSGASILGDGRVVLILNLAAVVERSAKARNNGAGMSGGGLLLLRAERGQPAPARAEGSR